MTFLAALFVLTVIVLAFILNGFLDKRETKKQQAIQKPNSATSSNEQPFQNTRS